MWLQTKQQMLNLQWEKRIINIAYSKLQLQTPVSLLFHLSKRLNEKCFICCDMLRIKNMTRGFEPEDQ